MQLVPWMEQDMIPNALYVTSGFHGSSCCPRVLFCLFGLWFVMLFLLI